MTVRSKFQVLSIDFQEDAAEVHLQAVSTGSKENEHFWHATPSGSISLRITNPAAYNQFHDGKVYYVDFAEAPF